ncbi:MAG: nitrate/sulfonate/bicarbonate ABC transporter ATP-binding protein [Deltaproteobacteria bacterium]|nr:nitrate/sulfonate/bicarbonate ABC transporter ATP-binding protein [Deltaproteobacteria bacterium]
MEPLCELRHVHKVYRLPNGQDLKVLDDINLQVFPEEILCLLGPSGCGKSTLMRILVGLIPQSAGQVDAHGKHLEGLNPDAAIVFQGAALYPWLTVSQNIEEALVAKGQESAQRKKTVDDVVELVGLKGFEDAYPRELSGGMKQRVGIARALAVHPELLCMDEPFSQVDALTAENLREEAIRFWSDREKNPKSILMVSHDIKEVAFMATRIVILAAHPGRIRTIVENKLPYPRDPRSKEFQKLVDHIHAVITESELPEEAPEPEAAEISVIKRPGFEVLPDAGGIEIGGLLEVLDDRGGKEDVFKLAADMGREYAQMMNVVKAAELIELVDTPKQMVVLTEEGRRYLKADPAERKVMFKKALLTLNVFKFVLSALEKRQHRVDADVVREELAVQLPFEDTERLFLTIVNWGRNADLFDYDSPSDQLFQDVPEEPKPEAPPPAA